MMVKISGKMAVFLFFNFVAIGIAIALVNSGKQFFELIYKSQLVLSPNSESAKLWEDIPPLKAKMYLFNVTNPDEVERGAVPQLQEVGPYVYIEHHVKVKLDWIQHNGTVTYKQVRYWIPVPEESVGPTNVKVTIINPVAATLGDMARTKMPAFVRLLLGGFMDAIKEQLFVTRTIEEIIFEGFDDPLLTAMADMKPIIKAFIPPGAFMDKFGFFYMRNGTDFVDGVFNIFTGQKNFRTMGQVNSWNYSNDMYFPGKCGHIRGSAGDFFPAFLKKDFVEMFSNDLCRTIKLQYNQTVSPNGISSYEYIIDEMTFANGTVNPENSCYNPPNVELLTGLYNTSLCRFGAPVFISQPHFYQADPYYVSQVKGLRPEKEKHSTYFRIEPQSGIPIQVAARFQLNVFIDEVDKVGLFENVRRSFIPVMWFENSADTPPDMITKMKLLANLQTITSSMGWAFLGVSAGVLLIVIIKAVLKRDRSGDAAPILEDSPSGDESDSGENNVFQE